MSDRRFYEGPSDDARRSAPAAQRNVGPIGDVLEEWLPPSGTVLEIASGTGEHAVAFAGRFPSLDWQPSDIHQFALESIAAWIEKAGLPNVRKPVILDAATPAWPLDNADGVVSINMVHISPWASAIGLVEGAARILPAGGPLIVYGPWLADDIETAPSNLEFDSDLRRRDPEWGLRRVEDFAAEAERRGFDLADRRSMPANNMMLRFVKR